MEKTFLLKRLVFDLGLNLKKFTVPLLKNSFFFFLSLSYLFFYQPLNVTKTNLDGFSIYTACCSRRILSKALRRHKSKLYKSSPFFIFFSTKTFESDNSFLNRSIFLRVNPLKGLRVPMKVGKRQEPYGIYKGGVIQKPRIDSQVGGG